MKPGQPVKLVFSNPDAMQHNLVIVKPGALEEVGIAGNEMAKDPDGIKRDFVPASDKVLHATKLVDPQATRDPAFQGAARAWQLSVCLHVSRSLGDHERRHGSETVSADRANTL